MDYQADLLLPAQARLGEGAFWDAGQQRLLWVDILAGRLHRFNPATGADEHFELGQMVGTVVTRAGGGVIVALQSGFAAYDLVSRTLTPLVDPEPGREDNRFNDGKCDPAGRLWAGTMSLTETARQGALYRLDTDLSVHKMLDGITVSNGIVWSADRRTMYYIDTPTRIVMAYDYDDASGDIENGRPVVHVPQGWGMPDGMAIDVDGRLWIAHWEGSCVRCWDPADGAVVATVYVPTPRVTACAFGGANMMTLYITTAQGSAIPGDETHKTHGGHLFVVELAIAGQPQIAFAG